MDLPNVRPGALSGTLQPFDADPLVVETIETKTQDDAGSGGVDETGDPISLTGDQAGGFDPAQPGDVDLPPADLDEAIEWIKAAQPDEGETRRRADAVWKAFSDPDNSDALAARITDAVYIGPPEPQTVGVAGIAPTSEVGQVGAQNPDADGSADPAATGEPPTTSEAESSDDSVQGEPNTTDDGNLSVPHEGVYDWIQAAQTAEAQTERVAAVRASIGSNEYPELDDQFAANFNQDYPEGQNSTSSSDDTGGN